MFPMSWCFEHLVPKWRLLWKVVGNVRRQGRSEGSRSLEWIFWGVFSLVPSCLMFSKKCRIVLVPGPAQPPAAELLCSSVFVPAYFPVLILYCSTQGQRLWVKPREEAPWTLIFSPWVRIDQIAKGIESSYILKREEAHTWAASMRLNYKTFKTQNI